MTNTDSKGRRIVEAKGKRYIVSEEVLPSRIPGGYVSYWTERNGETFGATRQASGSCKPGSVGRTVWDAMNKEAAPAYTETEAFGSTEVQEARSAIVNKLIENGMDHRAALDLAAKLADASWSDGYDAGHANGKAQYRY